MYSADTNQMIQNIRKIIDKYIDVITHLMNGKIHFLNTQLFDEKQIQNISVSLFKQMTEHPEKFTQINIEYCGKFCDLVSHAIQRFTGQHGNPVFMPHCKDRRFKDDAWQENIFFDFVKQFYLMSSEWIETNIKQYELNEREKRHVTFITRQLIDAMSPSNSIIYNPTVLQECLSSGFQNIAQGLDNLLSDIKKSGDILRISTTDKNAFKLGKNIAATEGKVILQNELMQLICYAPKEQTYKLPLLIVPSWINKYYILDLSKDNSMIAFLVEHNFQVFVISWKNPDQSMSEASFDEYLIKGIVDPVRYIRSLGYDKISAMGYCIGGTLLACAISYMQVNNLNYIEHASFFTTLLDFADPGDIAIFINNDSINAIEAQMEANGYFDGRYLSNSFSLIRANDLVWSFFVNNYLLGKTPMPFDILYWNADHTNLPAKVHGYYLRNMYLDNLLRVPNALNILQTPINLTTIDCNVFFLATNDDHIAPWHGVYASAKLLNCKKTFCLASSGHVSGVINPPTVHKYDYKISDDLYTNSEEWLKRADKFDGSWWNKWKEWLVNNNDELVKSINYKDISFIEYAPGSYVKK